MTLTLRAVVCEQGGNTGVILGRWRLRALLLLEAQIEADKRSCGTKGIAPNALEIIDATGRVLARRGYLGRHVHVPWRSGADLPPSRE
jgi:hypothetical protein